MKVKKENLLHGSVYKSESFEVFFGNKNFNFLDFKTKPVLFGKQTHQAQLLNTDDISIDSPSSLTLSSDGMYTHLRNKSLGIYTADCIPCFIISPQKLYSLHLGWKSLHQGLLLKALKKVSNIENIYVFLGPHIQQKSFEVQNDFIQNLSQISHTKDWLLNKNNQNYASLSMLVIEQLKKVQKENLFISHVDTFTSEEHYSYRRNPSLNNRNLSFAFLKK